MPEMKPTQPIPVAMDPRMQAVEPGLYSSEYALTRLFIVVGGTLIGLAMLSAVVLLALGRLDVQGLLLILGGLGTIGAGAGGSMVWKWIGSRTELKVAVAKGSADVAVAEAQADMPKDRPGFIGGA